MCARVVCSCALCALEPANANYIEKSPRDYAELLCAVILNSNDLVMSPSSGFVILETQLLVSFGMFAFSLSLFCISCSVGSSLVVVLCPLSFGL